MVDKRTQRQIGAVSLPLFFLWEGSNTHATPDTPPGPDTPGPPSPLGRGKKHPKNRPNCFYIYQIPSCPCPGHTPCRFFQRKNGTRETVDAIVRRWVPRAAARHVRVALAVGATAVRVSWQVLGDGCQQPLHKIAASSSLPHFIMDREWCRVLNIIIVPESCWPARLCTCRLTASALQFEFAIGFILIILALNFD